MKYPCPAAAVLETMESRNSDPPIVGSNLCFPKIDNHLEGGSWEIDRKIKREREVKRRRGDHSDALEHVSLIHLFVSC